MTAIAGGVGLPATNFESACRAMLQAQRDYGSRPATVRTVAGATFGCTLSGELPHDDFDDQPLVGRDRYLLVADVRLDNRAELLRALGPNGARSDDECDADILLRAWMRWDQGALDRIVGDYALAVFDTADQALTLARDPTGQRPLFYARQQGIIAFSSMPNALVACPFVQTRFRYERLASMLIGAANCGEATYFEGISRVRPGEVVRLSPGSIDRRQYWNPQFEPLSLTGEGFVEAYRECFDRAVRPRLARKSGLLGVHLSSGYDSSAVAATAARLSDDCPPLAFTSAPRLGFNGPVPRGRMADESELAALTARMHGMRQVVVRPADGALANLREHARLYQEPDRNIVNMEWWNAILREARAQGVSTMLTGQMGNLTIHAGGLPILAEWARNLAWRRWWREARSAARQPGVRWRGVLVNSFGGWLAPGIARGLGRAFLGAARPSEGSFLRDHWLAEALASFDRTARKLATGNSYRDRLELIRIQDPGVFRKGALAVSGIAERDPTADRRLIEFSLALPPEQLLHDGEWRPLARRALAGRLPDAVLNASLRGYQGADWYERLNPADARGILEEIAPSPAVNELLDLGKMRKAIDRWPSEGWADLRTRTIYRNRLPIALSTGVFLQTFEASLSSSAASPS